MLTLIDTQSSIWLVINLHDCLCALTWLFYGYCSTCISFVQTCIYNRYVVYIHCKINAYMSNASIASQNQDRIYLILWFWIHKNVYCLWKTTQKGVCGIYGHFHVSTMIHFNSHAALLIIATPPHKGLKGLLVRKWLSLFRSILHINKFSHGSFCQVIYPLMSDILKLYIITDIRNCNLCWQTNIIVQSKNNHWCWIFQTGI